MLSLFVGRVLCILTNRSMNLGLAALLDAKESVENARLFTHRVGLKCGDLQLGWAEDVASCKQPTSSKQPHVVSALRAKAF